MPIRTTLTVILCAQLVAGCGMFKKERPVYQGAEYYKNLEIPPDLSEPDTAEELRVPKPTEEALQRFRDNNELETVITPKFDGVRMVSYAGDSWVEIDNDVDHVWPRAELFFEREGIEIAESRPMLGYMETEWTTRLTPDKGFFGSIMQRMEPDRKHKFRLRFERFDDDRRTRLHIAHRGIERRLTGEFNEDVVWVTLPSDIEAERELLARMALFAGLDNQQKLALIENYRPYSSLVKTDRTDTTALTMAGSMDFVWRRALRALDRMEMKDIRQEKGTSTIYFRFSKLKDKDLEIQDEEDELAESSWLMQLFSGDDEQGDVDDDRQYRLELSSVEDGVRILVRGENMAVNTDDDGDTYGAVRIEQLRDALVRNLD